MLFKQYRIIFILIFMLLSDGTFLIIEANDIETTMQQHMMTNGMENAQSENKEGRALFPRLEYTNEWTPVGRGDPLKDPTYDYMPPVLDRVRYWAEGTSHKNKNDILLLGVPSKKAPPVNKKNTYGPIKRTYYSMPYQSHFSPPVHNQQQQQQQYNMQRMVPPHRMHATSDSHSMMSTHHYHHNQQHYQTAPPWKNSQNINGNGNSFQPEHRLENTIHHQTAMRQSMTTIPTKHPLTAHFLPTIPPVEISSSPLSSLQEKDYSSLPSTPSMSLASSPLNFVAKNMSNRGIVSTTARPLIMTLNEQTPFGSSTFNMNSHVITSSSSSKETTKPLLHSILQTESAVPFSFTKKPSSAYQIEYTSNIYSPEAINSMATSSTATFVTPSTIPPTKPSVRPMSMKTTNKMIISTTERDEHKHYVQPDMHVGWPVYNLIIEGHSKVKTYGLKNDDPLALSMPKIRPIQPKENPIVEHVTNYNDDGPEYKLQQKQKPKKESTMESLLSILDGSFGNLLTSNNQEGDTKSQHRGNRRKTRSIADVDDIDVNNKQERVVGVSFQVDERPQVYRKGSVISESMWPFENNADISR